MLEVFVLHTGFDKEPADKRYSESSMHNAGQYKGMNLCSMLIRIYGWFHAILFQTARNAVWLRSILRGCNQLE